MTQHPIYLSDTVYRLLAKRAVRESWSLEQAAERLLTQNLALYNELDNGQEAGSTSEDVDEALAAVYRLTTLFADVETSWLEQALDDPMLELANADLDIALL